MAFDFHALLHFLAGLCIGFGVTFTVAILFAIVIIVFFTDWSK